MLFFTGIFIHLGKNLMNYALKQIDEEMTSGWMNGLLARSIYTYYFPEKFTEPDEEKLFIKSIQIGEYWKPSVFYIYNGQSAIESGNEKIILKYLQRLQALSEAFDNKYPEIQYYRLIIAYHVKYRKMDGLLKLTDEAITFATKTDFKLQLLIFYCMRSMIFLINEDLESAKKNLSEAGILLIDFTIKYCKVHYLIAKCYIEIAELKKDPLNSNLRKQALNTTNNLINQSKKVRKCLPEAFRLKAQVYWMIGKPGKALIYFNRSISLSLKFEGNLELSRTYFEAGKFLRDPKNKKDRLNGMNGTECLLKARSMFEAMNLQWDLGEYEKYMGNQSTI
jgi:hypothetical protein